MKVSNSGDALPVPLAAAAEWLVRNVSESESTFQLAWMHQIVDLTTDGNGTQTLIGSDSEVLGTFTVNTTTNRLTIGGTPGTVPGNLEIVTVSTAGELPAPLVAGRPYVVREVSGSTFQLAWSEDHGEWIRHSAGAPFVSDEDKAYIQSGWSWTNWKIRSNYLEVPFLDFTNVLQQQWLIAFTGNGSTDRDYHIADNVGRFTGTYDGKKMYNLLMDGIENVTLLNNTFDYDREANESGEVQIYKAEKPGNVLVPIDVLYRFGNKDLNEQLHPWIPDDLHLWASFETGESYVHGNASVPKLGLGTVPLTGSHLTNEADAAAGAQQVSPATRWSGRGWKTQATAASRAVEFRAYVLPAQGATNPTGIWVLESAIAGTAFGNALAYSSQGTLSAPNGSFQTLTNIVAAGPVALSPAGSGGGGGSVTISPTGSGGSGAGQVTISPSGIGGTVTIAPANGTVIISPGGGQAATITPSGNLVLGGNGSSQTIIASGQTGTINNMNLGDVTPGTGAFTTLSALGIAVAGGVAATTFIGNGARACL